MASEHEQVMCKLKELCRSIEQRSIVNGYRMYTVRDVSRVYNIPPKRLYQAIKDSQLQYYAINNSAKWLRQYDIEKWIDDQRVIGDDLDKCQLRYINRKLKLEDNK